MQFLIKAITPPEVYDGSSIIYGTGPSPFINSVEELHTEPVGEGKLYYKTGLLEEDINSNPVLSIEEKKIFLKSLDSAIKKIKSKYGDKSLDPTNDVFWKSRSRLTINSELFLKIYDTDNLEDLILYRQIVGGGFQSIAPNLDIAVQRGKSYYVTTSEEFAQITTEEGLGPKRKAYNILTELIEKQNVEELLWLSWTLDIDQLKGVRRATSIHIFDEHFSQFIEGLYTKSIAGKKECATKFIQTHKEFKTDKESVILRGMFLAGYHFGKISMANGRYFLNDGELELGTTVESSIATLSKLENSLALSNFRDSVNDKLAK
jgi:hypothetical protein